MRRQRLLLFTSAVISATLWAYACGDGTTEPPPYFPEPATVTVSPATAELTALGATAQLSAEVRDQNNAVMTRATVTWASSAATVATVSSSGLVTAVANGSATITATSGSVSGSATVTVAQEVSAVAVTPAETTLAALGDTLRLAAEALDESGNPVAGAEVSWESSDDAVATVDASGLVTAVANGSATITATAGSASGTAAVTVAQVVSAVVVSPPADTLLAFGDTVRLTAEAADANGHAVAASEFSWTSSDTLVASVDASGQVTAAANGSATITATAGSASGTAAVTVAQVVSAVVVSPPADTLLAFGDTVRLTAEAADANGHAVAASEFSWTSSDTLVASVDASGQVTAAANGSATITATAGSASGTAAVTVAQVVSAVVVSPPAELKAVGATFQLEAEAFDANGHAVAGAEFSWESSDDAVATVDPAGLVTAADKGTATITASAGTAAGTAVITIVDVDVRQFLRQNPRVGRAMKWLGTDNLLRPYGEWPRALREKLVLAIDQLLGEGTGLPDVAINRAAKFLDDDSPTITILSKEDAEDLYVANVANSLLLEMVGAVPWSLDELSERELELLLSSQGFFFGYRSHFSATGYGVAGSTAPAPPELIREFLAAKNIVGGSRYETIVTLIDWARYRLYHYIGHGTAKNAEAHWHHRGKAPLARILTGTTTTTLCVWGEDSCHYHWTAGCHGTNWFFIHMLRAVNIPVEYVTWGGHAVPSFPSEGLYLSHGDDPYAQTAHYAWPFPEPFPTSEMLISEDIYSDWFNASNSYDENRNNVGRRSTELAVKYLPQWLLRVRCRDIANGVSNADSQVYRPGTLGIGRYWTVAELEAMNFWERMDAKIERYGGCPIASSKGYVPPRWR